MTHPGIVAFGAYVPRLRLPRELIATATGWMRRSDAATSGGERSFCNWDEDVVTMAVEAARDCLAHFDRSSLDALCLASTTMPFADRSNAGIVATALDLAPACRASDVCGSQRAGVSALHDALERSRPTGASLILAADRRLARPGSEQEFAYGHAAAAVLLGADDVIAEYLGGAVLQEDFVDHYRSVGQPFDYVLEERWIRDEGYFRLLPGVIEQVLAQTGLPPTAINHFIGPCPARTMIQVARQLGIAEDAVSDDLHRDCGDTGVAHPLLLLTDVLARAAAGDLVLLTGFGQGAEGLLFRLTERARSAPQRSGARGALARRRAESHYLRFLSHCGLVEMDWGLRAERDNRTAQSVLYRKHRDVTGFVGGRCRQCGTVQFPKSRACVNPECRAFDSQDDHRLADTQGRVKTFTEDWLAYTAAPPLVYGNVGIEGGGNVFVEFSDTDPGELEVGTPVRFIFRIKDFDRVRGFRRYFWKATPERV